MRYDDPKALSSTGLLRTLGIEVVEIRPERVTARMEITGAHHQPRGYLHGGVSLVLAETVASIGAIVNCGEGRMVFGMEINANHLRPKRDGMLTAVAEPIHFGKSSQVWMVNITDEAGKLVCVSRCTLAVVDA